MRWVTTVVLLAVLAGLGLYIFLDKESLTSDPTSTSREKRVFASFEPSDVTRVEVKNEKGSFAFERATELSWRMTSPRTGEADPGAIDSILTSLEFLEASRTFDSADPAFGLESPRASVTVEAGGGVRRTIAIGVSDAAQGGVYAKATDRDGAAKTVRIEKALFDAIDKDTAQFRNRKLTSLSSWQIERFALETPAGRVRAKKEGGNWLFEEPLVSRGDSEKIRELQNAVLAMQVAEFVNDAPTKEDLATYGLESPRFTVTMEGAPKEFGSADAAAGDKASSAPVETIRIGGEAPNDTVYATKAAGAEAPEGGAGVVTVSDSILSALKADFDSLRDHRLFSRPGEEMTRVELAPKDGPKTILVGEAEKKEGGEDDEDSGAFAAAPKIVWKLESPVAAPADRDKVEEFLRKFKELRADSFAPRDRDLASVGLAEPSLTVSASLKSGVETWTLLVGSATEDGASRYVKTGAEDHVYVVRNAELEAVQPAWHGLRDRKLLDFLAADARSVVVSRGGSTHEYAQKGSDSAKEWYRKAPAAAGADAVDEKVDRTEVTSFLAKFTTLRAESFATEDLARAAEFGIGPDATSITVTYSEAAEPKPAAAGADSTETKRTDVTKTLRVASTAGADGSFAVILDGVDLVARVRADVAAAAGTFLEKTGGAPPPAPEPEPEKAGDAPKKDDAGPPPGGGSAEGTSPEPPPNEKKDEGTKPDGAAAPSGGGD